MPSDRNGSHTMSQPLNAQSVTAQRAVQAGRLAQWALDALLASLCLGLLIGTWVVATQRATDLLPQQPTTGVALRASQEQSKFKVFRQAFSDEAQAWQALHNWYHTDKPVAGQCQMHHALQESGLRVICHGQAHPKAPDSHRAKRLAQHRPKWPGYPTVLVGPNKLERTASCAKDNEQARAPEVAPEPVLCREAKPFGLYQSGENTLNFVVEQKRWDPLP